MKATAKDMMSSRPEDSCDGGGVLSRRATCGPTELVMYKVPTNVAPGPVAPQQPAAAPVATSTPEKPSLANCGEPIGAPNGRFDIAYLQMQQQPLYPSLGTAPTGPFMMMAAVPQQNQIGVVPCVKPVKLPEACDMLNTSRKVRYDYNFTLAGAIGVGTVMTKGLNPAAQKALAAYQDLTSSTRSAAAVPQYIIPSLVRILSTSNDSPVSYFATAPWLPVQSLIMANDNRTGAFDIPTGTRSYSGLESEIYRLSTEDAKHVVEYKYLIGKNADVLFKDAIMPDASGTTVTVNENTELHRILCIFDAENLRNVGPGCALKYPIEVFRNTMTAMKTVTDLLASLVTSPDAMKITLNYVKPANMSDATPTPKDVVDAVIGDLVVDSADGKKYYLDKTNSVYIKLYIEYSLLV